MLKDKDPDSKKDDKKEDENVEEPKDEDEHADEEEAEEELEEVVEEEQNPDTVVIGSMIYLIDRMTFAYVKSHQEGNVYECITKKVSKDSSEVEESTDYLALKNVISPLGEDPEEDKS